ncbi:MAG: efflux RND transporter permease subunit [Rhizobiaceae bacterium]
MTPRLEKASAQISDLTALFVRRPVLALVVNLLIVVAGLAAFRGVEIRELPEVDSPVVTVSTGFAGAAPETMDREVTARIEGAAGRVPGVRSISSSSRVGRSDVTVEFSEATNIDIAASDLRDAVARIARDLPADADDPRIIKADANAQAVMRLALTSDRMSVEDLTILAEEDVVDRLSAVNGVADIQVFGDRAKVFRIDVDQARLAARGLTVADLVRALANAAFDAPAGSLTSTSQNIVVRATASISTADAFEALQVTRNVRLGDVATVTLGPDPGESNLRANGRAGVGLGIVRQAGSNTLDISAGVRDTLDEIRAILPDGVTIAISSDDANFIQGAIHEVEKSLTLSIAIVIAIIFLFLLDWRATLIPAVTLPVALVGTIAGLWLAGFSLNILTLLALVLATGLVVDDAIVVLENIVRQRANGIAPRAAAVIGTRQVFFAVIATTSTLVAVFVPLSFLPGKAGALFREFGFALAISVVISSVVALSLCPMMASRVLSEHRHGRIHRTIGAIGERAGRLYARLVRVALDAPAVVVALSLMAMIAAGGLYRTLPSELTPTEDRASLFLSIDAPQGVSLDFTTAQLRRIEALLEPMRNGGEIAQVFTIAGRGGRANSAFMVLTLSPWQQRTRSQQEIVRDVNRLTASVPGVRAFAMQPNSLGIRGGGSGLQLALLGDDYARLAAAADALAGELEKDERFGRVQIGYQTTQPQLTVSVDRDRATDLGIAIDGLTAALQAMLDGREIGTVFVNDRSVPVKIMSSANPVNDPSDLENLYLKTSDGRIVPMSSIAVLEEQAIAPSLTREQKMRAVTVSATLTPALALAEARAIAEARAETVLTEGMRIAPLGEAATLAETSGGLGRTFGFAIVIVLLVLAAQFESFVSGLIIMATVPLGLACAVFAMQATGMSLNVYTQIGLVLLVGIMAKNGILIVEFANQLRDQGLSVREAIERASVVRLRPVMMTMIATVLGGLPLVLGTGAGAEARAALGWVIVGGLGLATIATLFLTPVAYLIIGRFVTPKADAERRLVRELDEAGGRDIDRGELPAE